MPKGIQQASKAAQYRANVESLSSLGTSKDSVDSANLSIIEQVAGEFIQRVQANIQKEDMNVTGGINNITLQAEDGHVNIYGPNYLIYQDRGVNGAKTHKYDTPHAYTDKMPPVSVFKDWIQRKNINLRNNATYYGKESDFKDLSEDKQVTKAAWAMAKKVYNEGFKPRHVYSKEIPQLVEDLQEQLGNFAIESLVQQIDVKDSAKHIIIKM